jgi:hypothetical protein
MLAKDDEVRSLVKRMINLRLAETVGVQNITFAGEDIEVAKVEDGSMRFNLPRLKRSFAFLSGRLYERQFTVNNSKPGKDHDQTSPIVEQLNHSGIMEKVDTRIFKNKLVCKCGNIRWVKSSDLFQVKKCKPCIRRERNDRRKSKK